jgi:serine protease Do
MLSKTILVIGCCLQLMRPTVGLAGQLGQVLATCSPTLPTSSLSNEMLSVAPSVIQTSMKATLSVETPLRDDSKADDLDTNQLGSGVLISPDGLFLTNAHVVGNETRFTVRLFDGTAKQATLIGLDRLVDLAILRIDSDSNPREPFSFLRLKLSHNPQIGEPVVALGYPMNLGLSATRGIVSGLGRAYDGVWPVDFLQHDAALNPGNSGGPLIDAQGCLVGINTATPMETQFDIGVGLAIPAELIGEIAPQLLTSGKFPRGHLGIYVSSIDQTVARALQVGSRGGLLIDDIDADASAARAGLAQGDLITHLDNRPVRQVRDLTRFLLRRRQGEAIQVGINRAGQVMIIRITLSETPVNLPTKPIVEPSAPLAISSNGGLGFDLTSSATPATIQAVASDSVADRAGLQVGDTILALNGTSISSGNQAQILLLDLVQHGSDALVIMRIGRADMRTRHIVLRPSTSQSASGGNTMIATNTQNLPYGPL